MAYNYLWHFGDGQTSTDQNPYHIYRMAGEYEVLRERIHEDGTIDHNYFIIYVYEWDLTGFGMHVTYSDKCIRCAVGSFQGVGMVGWGGSHWLWPEAYVGTCNGHDKDNETISLVMDTFTGKHFRIGIKEQWLDRLDNLSTYFRGGYEIPTWFKLKEYTPAGGEYQFGEHIETYTYMRPYLQEYLNKEGYNKEGFREEFNVSLKIFKDGAIDYDNKIDKVPLKGNYIYRKKISANRLQEMVETTTSAYRCIGVQQKMGDLDKKPGPLLNTKSETNWQREFRGHVFWISRDSTMPILNRASGQNVLGNYDSLIQGPDSYSKSALLFGASNGLSFNISQVSGESTVLFWVSELMNNVSVWEFGSKKIKINTSNELLIDNGSNEIAIQLEISGWVFIAIRFSGDMVRVYKNGRDLGLHRITFGSYGGDSTLMSNSIGGLFDPRILPRRVTEDAILNYYDSVINQKGNTGYLPIMR